VGYVRLCRSPAFALEFAVDSPPPLNHGGECRDRWGHFGSVPYNVQVVSSDPAAGCAGDSCAESIV